MLFFITIIALLNSILAFEPLCSSCKFFIPHSNGNINGGFCSMFKNKISNNGKSIIFPNYAEHCRNDEHLCGKSGFLYEAKKIEEEKNVVDKEEGVNDIFDTEVRNEMDELNNRCCGEVNEKDELEQLEKEFFDVFQKIKKYNKKRVFQTTQDLYKLFKRNNK